MSSNAKRSPIRYIVLIFLILVLFLFTFFMYLWYSKIDNLKYNIAELTKLRADYSTVDSCIYILYQAENNSRLYSVTANKEYIEKFSTQVLKVSVLLSNLDVNSSNKEQGTDFKELVKQKKLKTERYLKIRRLTDSLIFGFSKLGLVERVPEAKVDLSTIKKQFKTVTQYDTIKNPVPIAKSYVGRLKDAIFNKKRRDSSITIIKTERNKEVSTDVKKFNDKIIKKIEDYYRTLYASANKLKSDEKAILLLNSKLISEIIVVLQEYKNNEVGYVERSRAILGGKLQIELKALNDTELINVLLLVSLIGFIFYNIYKLYRNERTLIRLSRKASQDSHSKSRFLANMSHEIRTPLNSVVGFSEQLSKSELSIEQASQVNAIINSSEMLLELVNKILDFSKYEVGKINLEHFPFLPEEEVVEVFNSMHVLAENKNILLVHKLSIEKDVYLIGDSLRLKQVVMNLLTNAIKFTANGQVTLKAQLIADGKKHALLKVQVEDTGIGMAEEDLDLIFDEFGQIYSSAKTQKQGTGLGLAICKKIVELQGGSIGVTSILGKGSIFSFEVPYEITDKIKEEVVKEKELSSGKLAGKRILLVDDNKMNVLLAQTILKRWQMECDCAYDGKEALELFKKNDYDLVLTDIQMPVMGGVEFTHEIRYNGNFSKSKIPILGITAHVLQENRDAYLKAGMNDLVLKPFLEKDLIDQIILYI